MAVRANTVPFLDTGPTAAWNMPFVPKWCMCPTPVVIVLLMEGLSSWLNAWMVNPRTATTSLTSNEW